MARACIVVGAGLGGIAAALRLRAAGRHVTLLEKGAQLGGRARVFDIGGFRFDAGPTVITAPSLIHELFAAHGRRLEDYGTALLPVSPWYRMCFDDGTALNYSGDVEVMASQIEAFNPPDVAGYQRLSAHADELCRIGYDALSAVPFHSRRTMLKALPDMARLRADRSVYQLVAKHLTDDRLRQAFSVHPLLVGGNPLATTSIYSLIHSLERREGIWFPRGGTGALVRAMGALAHDVGIDIRLNHEVREILLQPTDTRQRACGVRLQDGSTLAADEIVCNADPLWTYRHLMPAGASPRWSARKLDRVKASMGLFVLYFATRKKYPDIAHHTILFGGRFHDELNAIFEQGALLEDCSIYLHRPTATDAGMAPTGHDTFYALVAVPNLSFGLDWAQETPALRERVIERLQQRLLPGLRDAMVASHMVTPHYFQDELNSWQGAGFSMAPTFMQSAWFRFHNRAEGIQQLYFVGAGTHPGAGVPGVLQSARIVADLMTTDASKDEALPHAA
jgi:phytoene desaturase